ncbi:DUF484 family protein [Balneatrix alpica]|uniref:diguanylate cyclase n=1 Tax=Balneatrix alpica TaxID=75684 RepID=A0ABV5Z8N3_9GAMM|nr:DUF484 family protein [Balneatrix alpica]
MSDASAPQQPSLEERYAQLEQAFNELLQDAQQHQLALNTFRALELELLKANTLSKLLDTLLEGLLQSFKLDGVRLWLLDPEQKIEELLGESFSQLSQLGLRLESSYDLLRQRFNQSEPRLGAVSPLQYHELGWPSQIKSHAILPLCRQEHLIGALVLGSQHPQRYHQSQGQDMLHHFASITAVCIENTINQESLRQLSLRDALTQLWNRRYFDKALKEGLERACQGSYPLSCLLVDIDHFKRINDTYGHPAGDKALTQVAEVLRSQVRQTDIIARYGGEEFAVLLPGCDHEQALRIAESMRQQTGKKVLKNSQGQSFTLTLSLGLTTYTPHGGQRPAPSLATQILLEADNALYQAKRNGRNQVVFSERSGEEEAISLPPLFDH